MIPWEEHRLPFKQSIPTLRGLVLSGDPSLDPVTSGKGHVGGIPDFRHAGWPISSGGCVDRVGAASGPMTGRLFRTVEQAGIGSAGGCDAGPKREGGGAHPVRK